MTRPRRWIPLLAVALLAAAGCLGGREGATPTAPLPSASVASPQPNPSASPSGTPAPTPTSVVGNATPIATPKVKPTKQPAAPGALEIDGVPVTQVVVPDPAGPAVYAATRKGLYRSDGQGGWEFVSESGGERGIVADPTNPDIVYRGDHPPCAVGGTPQTLRKSADGGRTWTALQGGKNVRPVIVDPSDASVIYGERCTLAISPDAGQTWNDVPVVPTFDVSDLALAGKTLYGIYTSEGGTSRLVATDVSTPTSPRPGDPLLTFWGGGAVAATGDRLVVGEPHGVHVSPDGGKTWSFSRAGLEQVTISVDALKQPIPEAEQGRGFGIFAVAVDSRAPERIFAGTIRGLYASGDGGKTWSRVSGVNPVRVRALSFAEGGARLYVATDEGVVVLANP